MDINRHSILKQLALLVQLLLHLQKIAASMTWKVSSVQFSSVAQSCPILCNPMNCSSLGLPVHHQLPEFTQTHVHRVRDAIQPSHPLSSPSPPAPNPSQHQSLFQWVNSSHEVAKILEFQLQHHSLQRNPRVDLLQNGLAGSPCSPRDSQESSPTPQFKSRFISLCWKDSSWVCLIRYLIKKVTENEIISFPFNFRAVTVKS